MIVMLNGYSINNTGDVAFLDVQIDGLDLPPIRTSSGNYAGRDGGYVGAQFYGARSIGLQGNIFSPDVATLESARKALQAALATQDVIMQVLTNAGHSYVLYCKLIDFEMPLTRDLFKSPFQIELQAPDPTIYDDTGGGALTATVSKLVSGGYTYPVIYPVIYSGGGSPTTITNSGATDVFPKVTLSNVMNNPVLTNITTGATFALTGLITATGDQVVIDMRQKTVTLNGSSIFGLIGSSSDFWSLQPGPNSVTLTTPNSGDTVTAVFSWRSGVMAI
jgi:hypothetical protein